MRADATYDLTVAVFDVDGRPAGSGAVTFTTGALPDFLPEIEVRRLMHAAGADVVATRDHPMDAGCRSLFYLVRPRAVTLTPDDQS